MLGRRAFIKIVKNKVAPPFKRAEFDVMFGKGISRSGEILDLGVDYGIIGKSGSWFSYDGAKLAQGRDAAKRVIEDNPELAEELEAKIMEALHDADKSGIQKPKKPSSASSDSEAAARPTPEEMADEVFDDEFGIDEEI